MWIEFYPFFPIHVMMKSVKPWRRILLLVAVSGCSLTLFSTDIEFNNREMCRKELAGLYLTAYDEWVQARDFAGSLEKKEKEYTEYQNRLDAQLAKQNLAEAELDLPKRYEQETQARDHQRVKEALAEAARLRTSAITREATAQVQVTALQDALHRVFVQDASPFPREGYPFHWSYRDICPRFSDNCPLSPAVATQLDLLFEGTDLVLPDSC